MFFKEFNMPIPPQFPATCVSIDDFGARKNALCTQSIADAIAHVSSLGGGRVIIPAGEWNTGPIHMQSNVELHLEDGATLSFTTERECYLPPVLINYEGIRCYNYSPLIYGNGLENVAITGNGKLEGNGKAWWDWAATTLDGRNRLYRMMVDTPPEQRIFAREEDALRSPFIQILNSRGVLVEDVYIHDSPFWTVHIAWCENVTVRGITVENQTVSPNTDGVNIDACNRVLVENCTLKTMGDDMFCLKSGRNEDGRAVGKACENVVIRNCRGIGKSRSGGIVIGSEMSSSVRNILAHDCEFEDNANCIRIKSKDGRGGVVENIEYRNLKMKKGTRGINLSFRYSCEATDDPVEPGKYLPTIRNVYFEGITCDDVKTGITVEGIPGAEMSEIYFKDVTMYAQTCMTADTVLGLNLKNVRLIQKK